MKPSNLLLNSECLMKVADFGLALAARVGRPTSRRAVRIRSRLLATRWYRAPEILLGSTRYGKAVDMWSLGCIFGEMLGGKPSQGASTLNQLEKICEVVGRPTADEVADALAVCADDARQHPHQAQRAALALVGCLPEGAARRRRPHAEAHAVGPAKRLTAVEGMMHPYCKQFIESDPHCSEPLRRVAKRKVTAPFDDNDKKTTSVYREKLYETINKKAVQGRRRRTRRR